MQIPPHIQGLIDRYQNGTATAEELKQLNEWYHSFADEDVEVFTSDPQAEKHIGKRIEDRMRETIGAATAGKVRTVFRWQWAAAAAVLLLIAAAWFFLPSKKQPPPTAAREKAIPAPSPVIVPGGNKAILTLANGATIVLDTAANGTLASVGNVHVQKLENGLLAYNINGRQVTENDEAFYNTISTPRGGTYQVTLTDGTKVWLNAASSIRFPVVFNGNERKVEITGEAYFEVAKNEKLPFRVEAGGSQVQVLGTHFNVNAYTDEATVKTTLLEGRVRVSVPGGSNERIIEPGEQAGVNSKGNISVLPNADVEEAVAWKNGRFQFRSTDIRTILRQLSRWYDVDVVYKGDVNLHFTGQLSRSESVFNIFKKLELTGAVHFKVEDKTIIVSP